MMAHWCWIRTLLIALIYLQDATARDLVRQQNWSPPYDADYNGPKTILKSMDDLRHITYFSCRNFNITDESLMQSNWLLGLGNTQSSHKQHQKLPTSSDSRSRLASMLESFILHLRNGHLQRLNIEELQSIMISLNLTESHELLKKQTGDKHRQPNSNLEQDEADERCLYLVTVYKYDLIERQKNFLDQSQQPQTNGQQSNLEREGADKQQVISLQLNDKKLWELCQLAVSCQSADEMVNLISGPWQELSLSEGKQFSRTKTKRWFPPDEQSEISGASMESKGIGRHRTLRDSLSMSVAKLCPLILFHLHDNEGICSIRRDDRPSMITVWGFATLFVTIVSFCSLIGLSITPFLGQAPTDPSVLDETGSTISGNSPTVSLPTDRQYPHKSSLTLFEGLAVGSLVGSALFSLIPQAFELQERESNQSFLLKAFIIFSGIYLFFCSERIMRIILDTRQQQKRDKRLNHRGSNSLRLPSTVATEPVDEQNQLPPMTNQAHHLDKHHSYKECATDSKKSIKDGKSFNRKSKSDMDSVKTRNRNAFKGPQSTRILRRIRKAKKIRDQQQASRHQRDRNRMLKQQSLSMAKREELSDNDEEYYMTDRLTNPLSTDSSWSSKMAHLAARTSSDDDSDNSMALKRAVNKQINRSAKKHNDSYRPKYMMPSFKSGLQFEATHKDLAPTEHHQQQQQQQQQPVVQQRRDISTVAWMIVLGDGLHNFIDGISIGAAFSESILSGVSISVAVICEEFPHELGDFAVLVSSGMTVRQALGYNFISACTCYIGMAVGIILGDVNDGASYISALAAGVFLYIALVDMMGELSATLEESSRESIARTFKLLLLQNVGIFIGISIIFVLSFIDF